VLGARARPFASASAEQRFACALGIERRDEARQSTLARGYWLAVRVDDAGRVQSDYHTTQVPPQRRNRRFATRADELAVDKTELKTILSRRENRLAAFYTIALRATDAAGAPALAEISDALRAPQFQPFAGRKANVLMLPMTPHVVSTDDIESAFTAYDDLEKPEQKALRKRFWLLPHPNAKPRIYVDPELVRGTNVVDRYEQRRDVPESRSKWRFGLRTEALLKSTRGAP
jgi:CRISPR system Cascade subunit CasD